MVLLGQSEISIFCHTEGRDGSMVFLTPSLTVDLENGLKLICNDFNPLRRVYLYYLLHHILSIVCLRLSGWPVCMSLWPCYVICLPASIKRTIHLFSKFEWNGFNMIVP